MYRLLTLLTTLVLLDGVSAYAEPIYRYQSEGITVITNIPRGKVRKSLRMKDRGEVVKVTAPRVSRTLIKQKGQEYSSLIQEACARYGVSPALAWAVMAAESNFDPVAVSSKGAVGLMQLMPRTADEMLVTDMLDPRQNIFGGIRYLKYLTDSFNGDLDQVIAAYNAGPQAVRKAGGIPFIAETQEYVHKVRRFYQMNLE